MDDILDEIQLDETNVKNASKGKRFANYCIDILFFYLIVFVGGFLYYSLSQDPVYLEEETGINLVERLVSMLMLVVYYTIIETAMKGKTIGKLITKTRTVTEDMQVPDFGTILTKSFCRIVPFEAFSFLGEKSTGWHDRWSKTRVIED